MLASPRRKGAARLEGVMEIGGASAPDRVDGRTARALRTQQAIVDALLELNREGDLRPTGERIAQRAGVSLRALWTNFDDMQTLYAALGRRLDDLQKAAHRRIDPALPPPRRVGEFCRQNARMLEILAPAARAGQLREPFSAQLQHYNDDKYARAAAELARVFKPELTAAGPRRDQLLHALLAATTWPAWKVLRDQLELDAESATAVTIRTVTALLTVPEKHASCCGRPRRPGQSGP